MSKVGKEVDTKSDFWKSMSAWGQTEHHRAWPSRPTPTSSQVPSYPSLLAQHVNLILSPLTSHEHLHHCYHGMWHLFLKLHTRLELFNSFQNSKNFTTVLLNNNNNKITKTFHLFSTSFAKCNLKGTKWNPVSRMLVRAQEMLVMC